MKKRVAKIVAMILATTTVFTMNGPTNTVSANESESKLNTTNISSNIPTVYLNIDETKGTISEMNISPDHTAKCYGEMSIVVPEGYCSVDTGIELKGGNYQLDYIRGRGNSTWKAPKKPYKIKLAKKNDLLGMGSGKNWVLLANYYDNSLLRNRITYWLGNKLGMEYTPSCEPVDVVMNGEYYGSYFLCEQVKVAENSVNISSLDSSSEIKKATDEETISGGYLLGMNPDENDKELTFKTDRGVSFSIESPSFDGYVNNAQFNYIKGYMNEVENALYGTDFKNTQGVSYKELMDLDSAVMYFWIQEFSMNGDAFNTSSTYLYKERNDKLYWGPLWDFDYVAWGDTEYDSYKTDSWKHTEAEWFVKMLDDPDFLKALYKAWPVLKNQLDEMVKPGRQLDIYKENMAETANANFDKWGLTDFTINGFNHLVKPTSYNDEIERLRQWIIARENWVDEHVSDFKFKYKLLTGSSIEENDANVNEMPAPENTDSLITVSPEENKVGDEFSVGKYEYKVMDDKTVACKGTTKKDIKVVNIPAIVKNKGTTYIVKEVDRNSFNNLKQLKVAKIENNVEHIGRKAFNNCKNLKKVVIGESVESISGKSFSNNAKLRNVHIKASKAKIHRTAFGKMSKKAKIRFTKKG